MTNAYKSLAASISPALSQRKEDARLLWNTGELKSMEEREELHHPAEKRLSMDKQEAEKHHPAEKRLSMDKQEEEKHHPAEKGLSMDKQEAEKHSVGKPHENKPGKDGLQNRNVTSFFSLGNGWEEAAETAAASWLTLSALTEVNRPEDIDWKSITSMQTIAWKTGTSYGFRDAWAVGVTPRYAVGVWVGNATGEGKPGLVGAQTAGLVLFDIFNLLPSSSWFERPDEGFVEAEVCHQSGHLKGRFCEEVDTLFILPAGLRTEACPYHHYVTLSAD